MPILRPDGTTATPADDSFTPAIIFDGIDGPCRTTRTPEKFARLTSEMSTLLEQHHDLFRSLSPEEWETLCREPDRSDELKALLEEGYRIIAEPAHPTCTSLDSARFL